MAPTPTDVNVRMFNVGFGDCFGLQFLLDDGSARHVLIDFGSTKLPQRTDKKSGKKRAQFSMETVAKRIDEWCGGKLDGIVATHRHKDHIGGFAGKSGKVIAGLNPSIIVQPWTEDPLLETDARDRVTTVPTTGQQGFVASISGQQRFVASALRELKRVDGSSSIDARLGFLGENNIKNKAAVERLIGLGKGANLPPVYTSHGQPSGLEAVLPGVKVHVLGPPTVEESEGIKRQRHEDDAQFWHLMAHASRTRSRSDGVDPIFPDALIESSPIQARWLQGRMDRIRKEQLMPIVTALDDALNNTSLILLFEVGSGPGRKLLLFPGDAQIENWEHALNGPRSKEWRKLLAEVDLYKVGHHGSLNATPKLDLWEQFAKRTTAQQKEMICLLSTKGGVHGHSDRDTEVPRSTLVEALRAQTAMVSTQRWRTRTHHDVKLTVGGNGDGS